MGLFRSSKVRKSNNLLQEIKDEVGPYHVVTREQILVVLSPSGKC